MNTTSLLHYWLVSVTPSMHKARFKSLSTMLGSALGFGRLTVTSLGRSILNSVGAKHNIKRADRLLSNAYLQSEVLEIYSRLAKAAVGSVKNPVVLVDWSDVGDRNELSLIRASVAVKGRPVTLYEEVHDRSGKEKQKTHKAFLETLKEMLPTDCVPIVVTDAGFRNPWFKAVKRLGWHFVGRVRGTSRVQLANQEAWESVIGLFKKGTSKPKKIGFGKLTKSNCPGQVECLDFSRQPLSEPYVRNYRIRLPSKHAETNCFSVNSRIQ